MNSFFTKVSIVGILMGCISYTQAMENPQNGLDGLETQDNNDINNFTEVCEIRATITDDSDNDITFFTCDATRAEVIRYPILNYFLQYKSIEYNKPINYYLDRMQELIDSIIQFKKDIQDYDDGCYENYTKHKVTKDKMQEIFSRVWAEIISSSLFTNARKVATAREVSNAMSILLNNNKEKLLNNARNYTNEELLNLYSTFSDILMQYEK